MEGHTVEVTMVSRLRGMLMMKFGAFNRGVSWCGM